jgi:hypothetical protein
MSHSTSPTKCFYRTGGVAQAVKVPALQTRSSEFKPQSQRKEKQKQKTPNKTFL